MFRHKTDVSARELEKILHEEMKVLEINGQTVSIAQLEVVGLDEIVKRDLGKIVKIIKDLARDYDISFFFLNAVDIEAKFNLFITPDQGTQLWLEENLGVKFNGPVARREGLLLRKQIISMLRNSK